MAISKDKVRLDISLKKNTFELVKSVSKNANITKSEVIERCIWLTLSDAIKDKSKHSKEWFDNRRLSLTE